MKDSSEIGKIPFYVAYQRCIWKLRKSTVGLSLVLWGHPGLSSRNCRNRGTWTLFIFWFPQLWSPSTRRSTLPSSYCQRIKQGLEVDFDFKSEFRFVLWKNFPCLSKLIIFLWLIVYDLFKTNRQKNSIQRLTIFSRDCVKVCHDEKFSINN